MPTNTPNHSEGNISSETATLGGSTSETATSETATSETATSETATSETATSETSTPAATKPPVDAQFRLNLWLILILGIALLGLISGIIYLSVNKETLPDALTSLASLIVGGLLAFLNPVTGSRGSGASPSS